MSKPPIHAASARLDAVDALRGLAMLWMTAYHFCFDLNQFGYLHQDFYEDPLWTWQRTMILSLFLFCAGMGQAIAVARGQSWAHFWRRWAQIALCALLVTLGSWLMYPRSFIYFGVLHGMALMLIMARLSTARAGWLWALGAAAIAAKFIAAYAMDSGVAAQFADILNSRQLNWIGLVTRKPITEDYVPLLPWLGVMLWGVAAGRWLTRRAAVPLAWSAPAALKPLVLLGRWSLTYYMLHQPVMIGALMALGWVLRR